MKYLYLPVGLSIALFVMFSPVVDCQAGAKADPNKQALEEILKELQDAIKYADERMIAHPSFLDELRTLVRQYEAKVDHGYFYDDFADGNYEHNPKWVVKKGEFHVTPRHTLRSSVAKEPSAESSSEEEDEDSVSILFSALLQSKDDNNQSVNDSRQQKDNKEPGLIRTKVKIGSAFKLELSFVSESAHGVMRVILLGGRPVTPRYSLVYRSTKEGTRYFSIVKRHNNRNYTLARSRTLSGLDNGAPHRLQWIHDRRGNMLVFVDGKRAVSTAEYSYPDGYRYLALLNRGGTYEWGPIKISKATHKTKYRHK